MTRRGSPSPLRIHIGVNFFGAGNIGDDVMMAGFLRALGQRGERVQLTCCTPHDIVSQRERFPNIDWRPDTELDRARAIGESDIWLALGGAPFQLQSGAWMRDHLLGQMGLIRSRALPMFYLGVGVEDSAALDDPAFRDLAGASAQIWCRDIASAHLLRKWTAAPVTAGADLSHAYLSDPVAEPRATADSQNAELGLLLAFEDLTRCGDLNAALSTTPGDRITWLVQEVRTFAGSESDIFNSLAMSRRARLQPAIPDYRAGSVGDLLSAWPRCGVVASSRYHGLCIMAWRGARLVAMRRSDKIATAAADLDIPLIDCRSLSEGLGAARTVRRDRLIELAESTSTMVDDFCRVIGIAGPVSGRSKIGIFTPAGSLVRRRSLRQTARVQRIAVVKYDSIGDFVLLGPFMRELRRIWPNAQVILYVPASVAELARLCPYADRVVVVSKDGEDSGPSPPMARLAVPPEGYDLVFVPRAATDYFHGLRIASLIGGRQRWGFAGTGLKDTDAAALTHAIPMPAVQSHARINLALLQEFTQGPLDDRLELWPGRACIDAWRDRLANYSEDRPLCLLGIGSRYTFKMWDPKNFAAIIPEIIDTFGMLPVLVGSAAESDRAEKILSLLPAGSAFNLTGFSLEDVCAVSTLAKLYVGDDTGPKHIAAAAAVPVVEINPFPPDDVAFRESGAMYFHPHGVSYELLQPPAGIAPEMFETGAAVNSIRTNDVIAAIERLLRRTEPTEQAKQLQQIGTLTERLNKAQADAAIRLEQIHILMQEILILRKRLYASEADRATQLKRIHRLTAMLNESEAERAARLAQLRALHKKFSL